MNTTTQHLPTRQLSNRSIKKIGIFDSGIGGLSILQQLIDLPGLEIVYFADTAHVPYGKRSKEEIQLLTHKAITFLIQQSVELIIIACHTASTNALDFVKAAFPAMRFVDVVDLVIEQAIQATRGTVGILATKATAQSGVHKNRLLCLNPALRITTQACPLLASTIEKSFNQTSKLIRYSSHYLRPLIKANIDTLILACTHYALIQHLLKDIVGPEIQIISAETLIKKQLEPYSTSNNNACAIQWFISGNKKEFKSTVEALLKKECSIVKIKARELR